MNIQFIYCLSKFNHVYKRKWTIHRALGGQLSQNALMFQNRWLEARLSLRNAFKNFNEKQKTPFSTPSDSCIKCLVYYHCWEIRFCPIRQRSKFFFPTAAVNKKKRWAPKMQQMFPHSRPFEGSEINVWQTGVFTICMYCRIVKWILFPEYLFHAQRALSISSGPQSHVPLYRDSALGQIINLRDFLSSPLETLF